MAGVWLDRSDLEIWDFEVSKIWGNIAKKYFLEKKPKNSWEAFVSKYFISGIVLDFGGAVESLTWSISRIFSKKDLFFIQKVVFSSPASESNSSWTSELRAAAGVKYVSQDEH